MKSLPFLAVLGAAALLRGWGVETVDLGAVPETSTWVMMGLGFLALFYAGLAHGRRGRLQPAFD